MAGLLGIGGGMVLVPFISWIIVAHGVEQGLAVKMAIATSMATIFFTSMSSVRAHHRRGMVRWDLVKGIALPCRCCSTASPSPPARCLAPEARLLRAA